MRLAGKASHGRQRAGKSNEETVEKNYRSPWLLPVVIFCGRSCDMTTSSKFVQKNSVLFFGGVWISIRFPKVGKMLVIVVCFSLGLPPLYNTEMGGVQNQPWEYVLRIMGSVPYNMILCFFVGRNGPVRRHTQSYGNFNGETDDQS